MAVCYDVPFIANPNDRCVPATIGMVLAYFMPEKHFTMPELEQLCDYQPGLGSWEFAHMLALDDMGFEMRRIDDFDLEQFAANPEAYLRKILRDPAALEYQLSHAGELERHGAEACEYLRRGLHHDFRPGTIQDIRRLLDDGWLVRLEVNAPALFEKPGYEGHSILVIGYDDSGAIAHNPDGVNGNTPRQHISWEALQRAWKEFGGSFSLYAFRKPPSVGK